MKAMGFFSNLWSKAKGVLGRVLGIAKKAAPIASGVLGKVADMTGLPIARKMQHVADTVGTVAHKIEDLTGGGS